MKGEGEEHLVSPTDIRMSVLLMDLILQNVRSRDEFKIHTLMEKDNPTRGSHFSETFTKSIQTIFFPKPKKGKATIKQHPPIHTQCLYNTGGSRMETSTVQTVLIMIIFAHI